MLKQIKIHIKLAHGLNSVPIRKLAEQMDKLALLIESTVEEIGLDFDENWQAANFASSSCAYDLYSPQEIDEYKIDEFNSKLTTILSPQSSDLILLDGFNRKTIKRAIDFADSLGSGEKAEICLDSPTSGEKAKLEVAKGSLGKHLDFYSYAPVYIGSIMGELYSWTSGGHKPFIKIRDIATTQLVNCFYEKKLHDDIFTLFTKRAAMVIVTGEIKYDPISLKHEMVKITDYEFAPEFSQEAFDNFFGMLPGVTGGISSAEYIRMLRDEDS